MTTPPPDLIALAKTLQKAQERYTATWMDTNRDRCRRTIDDRDRELKAAESAFTLAHDAQQAEIATLQSDRDRFDKLVDKWRDEALRLEPENELLKKRIARLEAALMECMNPRSCNGALEYESELFRISMIAAAEVRRAQAAPEGEGNAEAAVK